ncbi:MAG: hypothetical protein V4496_01365 [Pseudomonadota bacterium]
MSNSQLLSDLVDQPYIVLPIIKEWLSVRDKAALSMSCYKSSAQWPLLFGANSIKFNIVDEFVEKATISDYKWLLSKCIRDGYPNAVYEEEKLRNALWKILKHPEIDPECRLLALRILSNNAVKLSLSNMSFAKRVDPLTFLLRDTLSCLDSPENIQEEFERLLNVIQEKISNLQWLTYVIACSSVTSVIEAMHLIMLMVNSVAHKLEYTQAQKIIWQSFEMFRVFFTRVKYYNALYLKGPVRLLSLLVVKFRVEDFSKLIAWLIECMSENNNNNCLDLQDFIEEIFSQAQFTHELADYEAVMPVARALLTDQCLSDRYPTGTLAALSPYLQSLGRQTVIKDTFTFLKDVKHKTTPVGILATDIASSVLITMSALARLDSDLQEEQLEELIQVGLTLLMRNNHSDEHEYIAMRVAKVLASLWRHLQTEQREAVMRAFWDLLNSNRDALAWAMIPVETLWPHLDKVQRQKVRAVAFSLCRANRNLIGCMKQAMILCVPETTNKQLPKIIKKLTEMLNGRDYFACKNTLEVLAAYISHFPEYPYQFDTIRNVAAKTYLVAVLQMTRVAQASLEQALTSSSSPSPS